MTAIAKLREELWSLHRLSLVADAVYESTHGEVTDETSQWERFVAEDSAKVIEALARFVLELDAASDVGRAEMARLSAREDRLEQRRTWAKEKLLELLTDLGEKSREVGTVTVSVRAGSQRVVEEPSADPWLLPEELRRVTPEKASPIKPEIAKQLKAGARVPGYRLERGPQTVVIK